MDSLVSLVKSVVMGSEKCGEDGMLMGSMRLGVGHMVIDSRDQHAHYSLT